MQTIRSSWAGIIFAGGVALTALACEAGDVGGRPAESGSEPSKDEAAEAARTVAPFVDRSTAHVVEDGTSGSADLSGGFQSVALARVNADGSVSHACVDS